MAEGTQYLYEWVKDEDPESELEKYPVELAQFYNENVANMTFEALNDGYNEEHDGQQESPYELTDTPYY